MTNKEASYKACWWSMIGIAICVLLAFLSSCTTTQYVPVIEHKTDTLIQTRLQRDSIYVHDSIQVTEKGDTIRIEKWHTKYIESIKHDTTYISKTDSIPVPYEVIKEVERKLSNTEKGLMAVGGVSLMALAVFLFWKLRRRLPF